MTTPKETLTLTRRLRPTLVAALAALGIAAAPAASSVVRGPDVSNNNGQSCPVNFHSVRQAGDRFGFAKATEGLGFKDGCFGRYWNAMAHEGLVRGAYDFAHPDQGSGREEGRVFVHYVKTYGGFAHAFAVLDIEAHSAGARANRRFVQDWVNEVYADAHPAGVVIYSGEWWWGPNIGGWFPAGVLAWPANYTSRPILLSGSNGWDFWQFTDGTYGPSPHYTPGIGNGDLSVFSGDYGRLKQLAGILQEHRYAGRTLHVGDIGTDVEGLQLALDGRLAARKRQGPKPDGRYGLDTDKARHFAEYALGFPLTVVKWPGGITPRYLNLIAHPDQRTAVMKARAVARTHR